MADRFAFAPMVLKTLDEGGSFSGYASVFGVQDYDGDVIVRGAFRRSIEKARESGKYPKMLWQHRPDMICGRWTEMSEDDHGLMVRGQCILEVDEGRKAYALLKAGVLDGLSVGFNITERGSGRVIEQADLWEVSLVTWGANPEALVTQVKARKSARDFELFLRESGFSRKEAVAIASRGFKAIGDQSDSGAADYGELGELVRSLRKVILS